MSIGSVNEKHKLLLLQGLIFIGISIAFSLLVIRDFSQPLSGMTGLGTHLEVNHDFVDVQEYNGFYFAENLKFNPFPHLDLLNNQVFYPYGVYSVFNPWLTEGDMVYGLLYSYFGAGPWLQFYYLFTVLITAIATFVLLTREYGSIRAFATGLLVSFGNFYAINKYPHHLQDGVVHWAVLSLIVDFLIVKRVVLGQRVSLKLILVRSCLLFLSIGQDLGYIAGFSLASFTVSMIFLIMLVSYRRFRARLGLTQLISEAMGYYKKDFLAAPKLCLVLLGLNGIALYLYFPLALQIAIAAKSFDFTGVDFGVLWANPLRLLIPYFPIINSPVNTFEDVFQDSPEASGAGSPGWFLVILGAIGLWQNRHQLTSFIPTLILFVLFLLYIPGELFSSLTLNEIISLVAIGLGLWLTRKRMIFFLPLLLSFLVLLYFKPLSFLIPTLKIFLWFTFNRVTGRSTVLYPAILCIFALNINLENLRVRRKQILAGILVGLACLEIGTAYSFRFSYQQPEPLDNSFFTYMNYVKQQPGEAVLDWPFCLASGGGAQNICPYYFYNSGVFALRRFHQKKVMGQYFGRTHESQVAPYFAAGWDKLFFPDDKDPSRQSRCFNSAEWAFFTDFFKFNDFAGINLYRDRLPEACLSEFYHRFGAPAIATRVPGAGAVQFIPKSLELRKQVNKVVGTRLTFQPLGKQSGE